MRTVFRLSRASYPAYDGEGARRAGGRWNSKGIRIVYMSDNRSLAILEVLVHLTDVLPDKYTFGSATIPDDIDIEHLDDTQLPSDWNTVLSVDQTSTRFIGDQWANRLKSAILTVPSVVAGERNWILNPAHSDFARLVFSTPVPFAFDARLFGSRMPRSLTRTQ